MDLSAVFGERLCLFVSTDWKTITEEAKKRGLTVVDLWNDLVPVFSGDMIILGIERLSACSFCYSETLRDLWNGSWKTPGERILVTDLLMSGMVEDAGLIPGDPVLFLDDFKWSAETSPVDIDYDVSVYSMEHIYRSFVAQRGRSVIRDGLRRRRTYDQSALMWCKNICACTRAKLMYYYENTELVHIKRHPRCDSCRKYLSELPRLPGEGILYDLGAEFKETVDVVREVEGDIFYVLNTIIGVRDPTKTHAHKPVWWYHFIGYLLSNGYLRVVSRGRREYIVVDEGMIRVRGESFTMSLTPMLMAHF